MNWEFEPASDLSAYLDAIKDKEEFKCIEKEGYSVINYVVQKVETFEDPNEEGISEQEARFRKMRRDCRGLIFNPKGKLISKPLHKFFNVGEKPETASYNIDLAQSNYSLLAKLDGSLVRPIFFESSNAFRLGTKMGITDTSLAAETFLVDNPQYYRFFKDMHEQGLSPCFEWLKGGPFPQIVLVYPTDDIVLLAVRELHSGKYMPWGEMVELGKRYGISVVDAYRWKADILEFCKTTAEREQIEGYVLRFDNGHAIKIKTSWYLLRHRSKDIANNPKEVVLMIMNDQVDDLKAMLFDQDIQKVENLERNFWAGFDRKRNTLDQLFVDSKIKCGDDRKKLAVEFCKNLEPLLRSALFRRWDGIDSLDILKEYVSKQCKQDIKFQGLQKTLGFNANL